VTGSTTVRVRNSALVGAVLGRVVGMLAARAQCPIDRLDDALLLTDAVSAHARKHSRSDAVVVDIEAGDDGLELRIGDLREGGAEALLHDAALPGVGNVLERVADDIEPVGGPEGDELVLRLRFAE
jgi:hypothetical protein